MEKETNVTHDLSKLALRQRVTPEGYIEYYYPDHPSKNIWVLAHRLVIEHIYGRYLGSNEYVHHIDFNKQNNAHSNLLLMTSSKHTKLHNYLRKFTITTPGTSTSGIYSAFKKFLVDNLIVDKYHTPLLLIWLHSVTLTPIPLRTKIKTKVTEYIGAIKTILNAKQK